jgi:uncharacterized protein (TIGR02687 family)
MKRVHEGLSRVFQRNRLVFWYDPNGEWAQVFEGYAADDVVKLKVAGNEFGTKVRIARESNPDTRFLIYFPAARPPDGENWLLDMLLQGHEFRADKASLILRDIGLPAEFLYLIEEHAAFFQSGKRSQEFQDLISKDDQAPSLRLKMMAVLASTAVDVDSLLLHFLTSPGQGELFDPVDEYLGAARLIEPFWKEVERVFGYTAGSPSIRDFAVTLFRGANPLDSQVKLHPHAKVFLKRWQDSQTYSNAFRDWSRQLERDFQIEAALAGLDEGASLGDADAFEIFDKFTLHRLCRLFEKGASATDLRTGIQQRRASFWQADHASGYVALDHAVELRELLASAELTVDSLANGITRYVGNWWRIDLAYRLCTFHRRRYGQPQLMEQIARWSEKAYVNNFLLPLADRWSDQIRRLATWECESFTAQRQFFTAYVQPFLEKGQKVFVIVSDALRYEAAADFTQRLKSANRWTAEIDVLFGSLPSYTQLGMASLLPGRQRAVDPGDTMVKLDDRSTQGLSNRAEILRLACDGRATALQATDFLNLNTKTDGRSLMKQNEVIYIFHDTIDRIGHDVGTEQRTFDAVEQAFEELDQIIKKVANINGSNMLVTADHGFLFQQDAVDDGDRAALPPAQEWLYRSRRFAIGRRITPDSATKIFDSADLGLTGDWSAAFPLSLGRFPIQGSGIRFVHGGVSLQEILVPVIRIHKARADDTQRVEVEISRVPAKITTGQVSIALFQKLPVEGKVLPRALRVGVFSKDGKELSEIKTHVFDSGETEPRLREVVIGLVMSHAADAYNNQDVEIRLVETLQGTSQEVTYKSQGLKLQKPFASDFDEF